MAIASSLQGAPLLRYTHNNQRRLLHRASPPLRVHSSSTHVAIHNTASDTQASLSSAAHLRGRKLGSTHPWCPRRHPFVSRWKFNHMSITEGEFHCCSRAPTPASGVAVKALPSSRLLTADAAGAAPMTSLSSWLYLTSSMYSVCRMTAWRVS